MFAYIVRRILATIPVMALLYIAPGDPAAVIAGDQATPDDVERIRQNLGLDRPFLVRFGEWVWRILRGDLGVSIFTNLPVSTMIAQRVQPTLSLMVLTLILAVVIAVPMGVLAAWKHRSMADYAVMTFSVLFTFTDFQLIYVLTRGGPVNATHLMATLSFQRAIPGGQLGEGAAIAVAMIPFLLAAILFSFFGLQRRKWQQGND